MCNIIFSPRERERERVPCNKKRITSRTRISANIRVRLFAVREHGPREKQKLAHSPSSARLFPGHLPFCFTHTRADGIAHGRRKAYKRRSFTRDFSLRYHFRARSRSSPDRSFSRRVHHPTSRSSLDSYPRRGYFSMEDSTSIRYISANTLPGCRAIRTRMHYRPPHNPPGSTGIYADCDLRYRKLLSKARPKMRGGCIKFLNSGMTATRRRCLPVVAADVQLHEAKPSERLTRQTSYFRKMRQSEFYTRQIQRRTIIFV